MMLTDTQKRTLKAKHEAESERERAAKQRRAEARAARARRLIASEKRDTRTEKRVRRAGRFEAYRNTPRTGVHGMRSGRKASEGPPQNKALSGPPDNKAVDEWPLKCEVEWYLKRYPEGEHADLARRILARD